MSSLRARGWGRGETNRCAISSIRERGTHTHTHRERRGIMFSKSILLRPGLPQISESLSLKNWSIRCTNTVYCLEHNMIYLHPSPLQSKQSAIAFGHGLISSGPEEHRPQHLYRSHRPDQLLPNLPPSLFYSFISLSPALLLPKSRCPIWRFGLFVERARREGGENQCEIPERLNGPFFLHSPRPVKLETKEHRRPTPASSSL